jgi:hypothetical protein
MQRQVVAQNAVLEGSQVRDVSRTAFEPTHRILDAGFWLTGAKRIRIILLSLTG